MDRQQAIKQIARAGKSAEAISAVSEILGSAGREYERIRSDATWSSDHKQRCVAQVYVAAQAEVDASLMRLAEQAAGQERRDVAQVFGLEGLSGDAATLAISRRDAVDRVARLETKAEMSQLLDRATRSGDEVLARAVAERATELQDVDTVNQFLADRPRLEEPCERLWAAQQRSDNDSMMLTFQTMAGTPAELEGLNSREVEQLTATEPAQ